MPAPTAAPPELKVVWKDAHLVMRAVIRKLLSYRLHPMLMNVKAPERVTKVVKCGLAGAESMAHFVVVLHDGSHGVNPGFVF